MSQAAVPSSVLLVPRSILVLRLSALGDVIHTIPAVVALRDALPDARIAWAVEARYREMVEIVTGVETIPVWLKRWSRSPIVSRKEIAAARRALRDFDASVDFQGLIKSAALGWLAGAKRRYGFDRAAVRETPSLLFTNQRIEVDTTRHVIDQNLELSLAVGRCEVSGYRNIGVVGHPEPRNPETSIPRYPTTANGQRTNWNAFPKELPGFGESIVLLPGAGRPEKLWPIERLRELARQIGERALAVWGPGEEERARALGCRVAPPTNLRELASILKHASLVVGGDTGPLHLAAALGTRVVGLYAPTNPCRNGPYGQLSHCIDKFESTKLMGSISVEEAMRKIERVLGE